MKSITDVRQLSLSQKQIKVYKCYMKSKQGKIKETEQRTLQQVCSLFLLAQKFLHSISEM